LFTGSVLLFSVGALSDRARLRQSKRLPSASIEMFVHIARSLGHTKSAREFVTALKSNTLPVLDKLLMHPIGHALSSSWLGGARSFLFSANIPWENGANQPYIFALDM
jgi:hypothetical protein